MSSDTASKLNVGAKVWTPKSAPVLPVQPPVAAISGYEYGHNDNNYSGANNNNTNAYNNNNRRNEYSNNGSGHHRNSMPNNRYQNNGNHNAAAVNVNTTSGQHMYGPNGMSAVYPNPAMMQQQQQYLQYSYYNGNMPMMAPQHMMQVPQMYYPDMYYPAMVPGNLVGYPAAGYPVLPIAQGLQPPAAVSTVLLTDAAGLSIVEPTSVDTPIDEADAVAVLDSATLPTDAFAEESSSALTEPTQLAEPIASESTLVEEPAVEAVKPPSTKDSSAAEPPLTVETISISEPPSQEPLLPEDGQPLMYTKDTLLSLFPANLTLPPSLHLMYSSEAQYHPPLVATGLGPQSFRGSPKGPGEGPPSRGSGNYNGNNSSSRDNGKGDYRVGGYRGGSSRNNNNIHHNHSRDSDTSSPRDGGRTVDDSNEPASPMILGGEGSFSSKVMRNLELSQQDREPVRDSPDVVIKKATLILNKLTPTKFDKLSDEFLDLVTQQPLDSMDLLNRVVELLVTKAQLEENFCFIYADLCKKIIDCWMDLMPSLESAVAVSEENNKEETAVEEEKDGDAAATPAVQTMGAQFRLLLLARCQKEFETDMQKRLEAVRAIADLAADELAEKELLIKKRYIGHMRFIGEIYIKDLVQGSVINEKCLKVLILETDEEQLVCLCKLLQTVGDKLEKYYAKKAKTKKGREKKMHEVMPCYFTRIQQLAVEHPSSRIRYMLQNLSEMRSNDWTARVEADKVVDLSESRKPAYSSVSVSNAARMAVSFSAPVDSAPVPAPAPVAVPAAEDWTVVKQPSKTKKIATMAPAAVPANNKTGKGPIQSTAGGKKPANPIPVNPPPAKKASGNNNSNNSNNNGGSKQRRDDKDFSRPPSSAAKAQDPPATPLHPVEEEVSQEAEMNHDLVKKLRTTLNELFASSILEEARIVLRELVPPNCTAEMVREAVAHSLDTNEKSRTLLAELLHGLCVSGSSNKEWVLSGVVLGEGFRRLLEELDDLVTDVPFAFAHVANMVGGLVHSELLSLAFLRTALADPDSIFCQSQRAAEFVLQVLQRVSSRDDDGLQRCESALRQAGIELRPVLHATLHAEEKLPALLAKYPLLQPLLQ